VCRRSIEPLARHGCRPPWIGLAEARFPHRAGGDVYLQLSSEAEWHLLVSLAIALQGAKPGLSGALIIDPAGVEAQPFESGERDYVIMINDLDPTRSGDDFYATLNV